METLSSIVGRLLCCLESCRSTLVHELREDCRVSATTVNNKDNEGGLVVIR